LRGFGSFRLRKREPRKGTAVTVDVPPKESSRAKAERADQQRTSSEVASPAGETAIPPDAFAV
jgi:nucleoid DNA-binding protein